MAVLLPERRRYLGISDTISIKKATKERLRIHAFFDRLSWPCDHTSLSNDSFKGYP